MMFPKLLEFCRVCNPDNINSDCPILHGFDTPIFERPNQCPIKRTEEKFTSARNGVIKCDKCKYDTWIVNKIEIKNRPDMIIKNQYTCMRCGAAISSNKMVDKMTSKTL